MNIKVASVCRYFLFSFPNFRFLFSNFSCSSRDQSSSCSGGLTTQIRQRKRKSLRTALSTPASRPGIEKSQCSQSPAKTREPIASKIRDSLLSILGTELRARRIRFPDRNLRDRGTGRQARQLFLGF